MRPNELSALEARRRLARGELTCQALVQACLERIAEREPQVGAWAHLDPKHVFAQARRLDATSGGGSLFGLPIGVKDVIDTADLPTAYGSPIYQGHRPSADAACVAMARRAGAVIAGKTVTTEFATAHPGGTRNPHNLAHTPGGSSSGSAAAVADFMIPFAFGTQTGGSTLRPASFCGIVGFKPSFGLINRTGVKPVSDALDTVGLFARDVQDVALLAAATTGCDELARIDPPFRPRIGIWRGAEWESAQAESIAAVDAAAAAVERAGALIADAIVPAAFAGLTAAHHDIEYFEMARGFGWEHDHHREKLSATFLSRLAHGAKCTLARYREGLALAQQCRQALRDVMQRHDALLCPSAPGEAPEGLASTGNAAFNRGWTLLHVPTISVPGLVGSHGLPVGVQLVGAAHGEAVLLGIAELLGQSLRGTR